ncbi:MAG: heparan-alpha-glucosaminide N-acetyltransferase domain-containing protein [Candidatus Bathyarchaeia archaeon]
MEESRNPRFMGLEHRLPFIDFARGVAMVLMAWDHVSSFWNPGHRGGEGLMGRRPVFPDFTQFILRFITHVCAPTFIFLAGTALALSTRRRLAHGESEIEISLRMIKRGSVLVLLAIFVESPAFGLPPLYFGVLSCIGACLIIFSLLHRLPQRVILILSTLIILAHPLLGLSWIPMDDPWGWYLRVVIHEPSMDWSPFVGLYPIIPWIGVMGLGWCFGSLISRNPLEERRLERLLASTGVGLLCLWLLVRALNGFGNLLPRLGSSLQDWLYMAKYPPSLAFLLWTLGWMFLILSIGVSLQRRGIIEKGLGGIILAFGRVPLFFYCTHLWLYRLRPGWAAVRPFSLSLPATAAFWLMGLMVLWRLCLRYERLKLRYPESILQYL